MFNRKVLSLFFTALAVTTHTAHAQNRNRFLVKGTNGQADKENQVENVVTNRGGKVVKKLGKKNRQLIVVEFPSNANPNAVKGFKNRLKTFGYEVDVDEPMYPIPIFEDKSNGTSNRKLADDIPWGISSTFKLANGSVSIPNEGYFPGPGEISKPICIIDSGYMINHPDLPNDAINADPAQGSGSSTPYDSDRSECSWHGTHVAGTIAAMDNEVGVLGVFPGLPNIKVVRVFSGSNCGYTYTSSVHDAVQACVNSGAKVVTMSLGCDGCYSSIADNAFRSFYEDDGILNIAAAGNSGNTAYSYPASYDSVMSVGAIDSSETIVSFSQYNDQVDIAAPGYSVKSTTGSNSYSFLSGTSMATPHVSGAATLLWNKYPQCTNLQVRAALQNGALDKGASGKDPFYGHGILRYYESAAILANNCGSGPTNPPTNAPTYVCNGKLIEVDIKTDNYAYETTWTLTNKCTGEALLSGGPYSTNNYIQPTEYICVEGNSDYEFVINDSYGDGICCSYGNGWYKVSYDGVEAVSGGSFAFSETKVFGDGCGATSSPTKSPIKAPTTSPTKAPTKAPTNVPTKNPTVAPTKAPTAAPSTSPTKAPTESPVASPVASPPTSACPSGQSLVEVDLILDNYPSETSWSISKCNSDEILLSGGSYFTRGATISESKCLPSNGSYQFVINDSWGDGICCSYGNGSFNVKFGGSEVAAGGAFAKSFVKAFGNGVVNGNCPDPSTCPLGEKLLKVAVKADYYPYETSWSVATCDGTPLVSGTTGSVMRCVPDFSYTFTIFDSYGDGICCSYGQGSYEVTFDGAIVASGGEFAYNEQTKFNGICPSNRPIPNPIDVCNRILKRGRCKNTEGCAWSGLANNGYCAKAPKEIPEKARNN